MIKTKGRIKGKVSYIVWDADGNVKRRPQTFIERLFNIPGKLMMGVNHNIVTDQGDALIADLMAQTPAKQKLDNTHAYIAVGTAYSETGAKAQTGCHTQTGNRQGMEATYPVLKGTFGNTDDNVVKYRAIFAIGSFGTVTINEAALMNASTSGECLAYAQVSPSADVTASDSLQVDWELTFLGA